MCFSAPASFTLAATTAAIGIAVLTQGRDVRTFLIFAEVVWPVLTPLAVLLIEPDHRRRQILNVIAGGGTVLATFLLVTLLGDPATVAVHHDSLRYTSDVGALSWSWLWRELPYLICTCAPLLLSSHRIIRVIGAVVLVGFAISAYAYYVTFTSVWCFFAAADSTLLFFHFRRAGVLAPGTPLTGHR